MKNLSLDLDQLQVESFSAGKDTGERGTIGAHIDDTVGAHDLLLVPGNHPRLA